MIIEKNGEEGRAVVLEERMSITKTKSFLQAGDMRKKGFFYFFGVYVHDAHGGSGARREWRSRAQMLSNPQKPLPCPQIPKTPFSSKCKHFWTIADFF